MSFRRDLPFLFHVINQNNSASDVLWTPDSWASTEGWLDASDEGSITETSGAVSQWDDKSGNNYHATASGASRPTTGANTQNSLNVIDFSSDWFVLNSGLYGLLNQAYSLFAVSKTNNNGSQQRIINFDNGGSVTIEDTQEELEEFQPPVKSGFQEFIGPTGEKIMIMVVLLVVCAINQQQVQQNFQAVNLQVLMIQV